MYYFSWRCCGQDIIGTTSTFTFMLCVNPLKNKCVCTPSAWMWSPQLLHLIFTHSTLPEKSYILVNVCILLNVVIITAAISKEWPLLSQYRCVFHNPSVQIKRRHFYHHQAAFRYDLCKGWLCASSRCYKQKVASKTQPRSCLNESSIISLCFDTDPS